MRVGRANGEPRSGGMTPGRIFRLAPHVDIPPMGEYDEMIPSRPAPPTIPADGTKPIPWEKGCIDRTRVEETMPPNGLKLISPEAPLR